MTAVSTVALTERASRLLHKGRPWYFEDDLDLRGPAPSTGLVRICDHEGRDVGLGLYSEGARLRLRWCGPWLDESLPTREAFYRQRLHAAILARGEMFGPGRGCRLVHGESDGLPGLVVDAYDGVAVIQVTARAVEQALDAIVPGLVDVAGVRAVLARNDTPVRKFEGLPQEVRWLHGRAEEAVEVEEHGVRHRVRLVAGHKTGFYLDQRPARKLVRDLSRGRRVLDAFAYQGGFSLAALRGGAVHCVALDQSEAALDEARAGAERNGLEGLELAPGNAFDTMRERRARGEQYGVVIVDPPAFAKSRREVRGALRGYRDLNRLALRLLEPGGDLITCTCSHHVSLAEFEDLVRQGTAGLPFRVVLKGRYGAGEDHPAWMSLPESEYLKVLHVRRVDPIPTAAVPEPPASGTPEFGNPAS